MNPFAPWTFEHRAKPLLSRKKFYHRLARCATLGVALLGCSLMIGTAGYHLFEGMNFIDSFSNAAMILSGMGPLGELKTQSGKIFAGCYALFSGVAFLTSVGVVFAPIFHRFLHMFHLETKKEAQKE